MTNVIDLDKAVDLSAILHKEAEERAKQLPMPQGYRILCAIPEAEEAFDSGILKSDETMRHDELLTTVLFVVDMGPDCYQDKTRFPNGPWCKKGDFVLVANAIINCPSYKVQLINRVCVCWGSLISDSPR